MRQIKHCRYNLLITFFVASNVAYYRTLFNSFEFLYFLYGDTVHFPAHWKFINFIGSNFFFFYVFNMYRVFLHSIGRRNFIFQWVHIISQKLPIFRAFICNTFIFSLEFTINGIESFAEEKNEPHVQYLYYLIIEISVWINVKKIFCLIVSFKWRSIFNKLKIFNNL